MPTRQRQQFIHAHLAWMVLSIVVLTLLGSLTLELFFVLSLIGLLVTVEMTSSIAVSPRWRKRLKWIIAVGLLGFAYIVIKRILQILPSGLV